MEAFNNKETIILNTKPSTVQETITAGKLRRQSGRWGKKKKQASLFTKSNNAGETPMPHNKVLVIPAEKIAGGQLKIILATKIN
jgi:hypothetical protein